MGLAFLWLATLSLAWTGGSYWLGLGLGLVGALGTLGHWMSWRWRHQPSKLRTLLVVLLVVALSAAMQSQMVQALEGNWLPMARFLLIVQALSSFDLRTRSGLYTSMALGGTVLFFASRQSFDPSFGFLVMGFVVLLLSFPTIAFLEDGTKDAQVHWSKHWLGRPAMWPYWIAVACAVFAFSGLALWLMPLGGERPIGPAQAFILPYFGDSPLSLPPLADPVANDLLPSQPTGNEGAALPERAPDLATGERPMAGGGVSPVGKLFQEGAGDQVSKVESDVPSRLAETQTGLARNPIILGLLPVLAAIIMVARWSLLRASRGADAGNPRAPGYERLPGQSRRDFLKLYRRVETLLRHKTGGGRMPWQTVEAYAAEASAGNPALHSQLTWFTRTMWQAAYDPRDLPDGLMTEARARMAPLKAALRASGKGMAARRNPPL